MSRKEIIKQTQTQVFDVCIIGGGITGAGILYNVTERGWKAIMIEKGDLASGTSSRSSKLIHGGVRYLKYLQFKLIREAIKDRWRLSKIFPHMVKPIPFILPSYNRYSLFLNHVLLTIYDLLAGTYKIQNHIQLTKDEMLRKFPFYRKEYLTGGNIYWENQTNDAQLNIELISNCAFYGQHVLTYTKAKKFNIKDEKIISIVCDDVFSNQEVDIKAKVYINATGVWTDELIKTVHPEALRMQPSKGVHILIPSSILPTAYACLFASGKPDNRYLYTIPWENNLTLVGATDTEYIGDPDEVITDKHDVEYIIGAFNKAFPNNNITVNNIAFVYAGLRPLLADKGNNTYKRSREYQIWWSKKNLINIAGGKFTSCLSMGEKCVEEVLSKLQENITGSLENNAKHDNQQRIKYKENLLEDIIAENKDYNYPVANDDSITKAEVLFFVRHQFALHVEDILTRRTSITHTMLTFDERLVKNIASVMAAELGQDDRWIENEIIIYYNHWEKHHFIST